MAQDAGPTANRKAAGGAFIRVLGVNAILSIAKLAYGLFFGLLSMVADGLHSLLDCSANALATIGITMSMKPADADHPYGHRKFEALAAVIISFIMFFSSYEIVAEAIHRFLTPGHFQHVSVLGYCIVLVSLIANCLTTTYEHKQAKLLGNSLLAADAKHSMSDIFTSLTVLVTMVAIQLKMPLLDLVGSLAIVGAILYAGYQIIVSHLGLLVDQAALDAAAIERVVMGVPGVSGCHKIRSRGIDDYLFIDLHVQVARHFSIEEAHDVSFAVEAALKGFAGTHADVLVHIEDDSPPAGDREYHLIV